MIFSLNVTHDYVRINVGISCRCTARLLRQQDRSSGKVPFDIPNTYLTRVFAFDDTEQCSLNVSDTNLPSHFSSPQLEAVQLGPKWRQVDMVSFCGSHTSGIYPRNNKTILDNIGQDISSSFLVLLPQIIEKNNSKWGVLFSRSLSLFLSNPLPSLTFDSSIHKLTRVRRSCFLLTLSNSVLYVHVAVCIYCRLRNSCRSDGKLAKSCRSDGKLASSSGSRSLLLSHWISGGSTRLNCTLDQLDTLTTEMTPYNCHNVVVGSVTVTLTDFYQAHLIEFVAFLL